MLYQTATIKFVLLLMNYLFVLGKALYMTDRPVSTIGSKLFNQQDVVTSSKKITVESALWMMTLGNGIGKTPWR